MWAASIKIIAGQYIKDFGFDILDEKFQFCFNFWEGHSTRKYFKETSDTESNLENVQD